MDYSFEERQIYLDEQTRNYTICFTLELFCMSRFTVTSFQSLHCTLTSSIRGPDLFPKLFDDGQQLCIFVLRHLATTGALEVQQTEQDKPGSTHFTVLLLGFFFWFEEGTLNPEDITERKEEE